MKINVTCSCGSSFQAPESLAGQTVRCPSCRSPLTVTAPPAAPEHEPEIDFNDLTSLDQSSAENSAMGSTAGRTAMGQRSKGGTKTRKAASSKTQTGDSEITQELDDRMTRMYEVYAGKKASFAGAGSGNILKLLIGLGIAVIIVGIGVAIGWNILKDEYGDPMDSLGGMIAGATAEDDRPPAPDKADRVQHPDVTKAWEPGASSAHSGVDLKNIEIALDATDESRLTFAVKVVPTSRASDSRLSMAASVALYRSTEPEGSFTQADRVAVQGYDTSTGSLTFDLFDQDYASENTNLMYYRVTGFDSEGKRLFDTPATRYSCVTDPVLAGGQVTWKPKAEDKALPAIRVSARLDAPGWEDILLWQVRPEGPVSEAMPDSPTGLPVVVESAAYQPTGIELDGQGVGRWQMQWVSHELDRRGGAGKKVVGIRPDVYANRMDLRAVPDEKSFDSVSGAWVRNDQAGISRVLNFTPSNGSSQTVTLDTPPTLRSVNATAYDGRVHLSWDNTALLAGLDRYVGALQIVVRRIDSTGNETLIAELSSDQTSYTDTEAANGAGASYEVSLVQANAGGAAPTVHASAWLQGQGKLPVLTHFPVSMMTARVEPEPGLGGLVVSLGVNELSYSGTGPASVAIQQHLTEMLDQVQGVSVVDRAALRWFAGLGAASTQPGSTYPGQPAQVQIRLVDSTSAGGDRLALWVTDNATGQSHRLAGGLADEAVEHPDVYINALKDYLSPRIPSDLPAASVQGQDPRLIVVGPIYPVEDAVVYYYADELAGRLAKAADQSAATLSVVTREFWMRDTLQDPVSIDLTQLQGAVLVVGRAWSADAVQPGVSLRAIDATTGRVIARFESDAVSNETVREFSEWCASLKTTQPPDISSGSPLLLAEAALSPIHPVWQDNPPNATSQGSTGSSMFTGAGNQQDAVVITFGLPLPSALSGAHGIIFRDPGDPLFMLRPSIAPQHPLAFDDWTQAYADYLDADNASFIAGFEQIRRIQQADPGEFKPKLIMRGETKFVGDGMIPAGAGGMRVTPTGLNVRTFFPMGVAQQPMIDYRQDLSEAFKANPWLMSQAWSKVSPTISDPFLRGELFGIGDGRFARLEPLEKPAPFATYIAANLLAHRGNREAFNYKQKALALATKALAELTARGGSSLNEEQMQWAVDALLVLIYEKDPGTIAQMADSRFRNQYFKVGPESQTDTLRMLVDRIGPSAWGWAKDFDSIDWPTFCWRSYDEMDAAIRSDSCPISEEQRQALRQAWATPADPGDDMDKDVTGSSLDLIEP